MSNRANLIGTGTRYRCKIKIIGALKFDEKKYAIFYIPIICALLHERTAASDKGI
jgi:hypothetical protein